VFGCIVIIKQTGAIKCPFGGIFCILMFKVYINVALCHSYFMGEFNHEQLSFDSVFEPKTREQLLTAARKARRVALILKAFDLMSAANDKSSFAYQLEKQDENYKNHKKSHPLSEKYQGADHNVEYAKQQQLDDLAADAYDEACFNCVESKKDCFVNSLPPDPTYRYVHGIEPLFRYADDRKPFKKELKKNPDAVCFPYHKRPALDK